MLHLILFGIAVFFLFNSCNNKSGKGIAKDFALGLLKEDESRLARISQADIPFCRNGAACKI